MMFYQIVLFFKSIFIHILYFYVCLQEKNEKTFNTIKNVYLIEIDDYQGTKSHLRHGRVLSEDYFNQIIF
jgi:hypothetical protein